MTPQPPKAKICPDRERLSETLLKAVSVVLELQSEQTANIISEGSGLPRIELALAAARQRWEDARNAYTAHILEHR